MSCEPLRPPCSAAVGSAAYRQNSLVSRHAQGKGELDGVRLLQAKTVEMMTTNGLSEAVQKARGGSMGWGLANVNVQLPSAPNATHIGEYGWDGTAGTIFWVDPTTETVTVLMTQSVPANPDQIRQRFKGIVDQAILGR